MKSVTYKLLTALYLREVLQNIKDPGSPKDPDPGSDGLRSGILGADAQILSRLFKKRFILRSEKKSPLEKETSFEIRLNYLGRNHLLSRFPLLSFLPKTVSDPDGRRQAAENSVESGRQKSDFSLPSSEPPSVLGLPSSNLTLVIFNIPESQRALRDRLRYQLKTLGFGTVSRSVYLSPHWSVKETQALISQFSIINFQFTVLSFPWESFKEVEDPGVFWQERLSFCNEQYERALASFELSKDSSKFLNHFIQGLWADPLLPFDTTQGKPPPPSPKNALISQCLEIAKGILS